MRSNPNILLHPYPTPKRSVWVSAPFSVLCICFLLLFLFFFYVSFFPFSTFYDDAIHRRERSFQLFSELKRNETKPLLSFWQNKIAIHIYIHFILKFNLIVNCFSCYTCVTKPTTSSFFEQVKQITCSESSLALN